MRYAKIARGTLAALALLAATGAAAQNEYQRLVEEGRQALRGQDYSRAAELCEQANALADGESKECLSFLGIAYTRLEDPEKAVAVYEKLHEITGGVLYEQLRPLTEAYRRAGRPEQAAEACRLMIRRTQQETVLVRTYNELGYWLLATPDVVPERLEEAEAAFSRALELSSGQAEAARLNLAEVRHRRGRAAEIAGLFAEIEDPRKADSWRDLRRIEISEQAAGLVAEAREAFRLAAKRRIDEIVASGEPMQVGGDVKKPEKISAPPAQIPDEARRAKVNGVVILQAVIDVDGNVGDVKVIQGLPYGLTEQTIKAVKRWKFKPATLNGEPVPVYYNLTMNFRTH